MTKPNGCTTSGVGSRWPSGWGNGDVAAAHDLIDAWNGAATLAVPRGCAIVASAGGPPVGTVLLSPLRDTDEVEIGWQLHRDNVGRGWASEAAAAMLAHGLAHHDRLWAVMWPANAPSVAVADRIGMHDLGQVLDPWYGSALHPHSRIFVATTSRGTAAHDAVTRARTDLASLVTGRTFPDEPPPKPAVVLPGWRGTAARLVAEVRHNGLTTSAP